MLSGTIIEKGSLFIPNRHYDFDKNLIKEAMQAINDIIEEQFDYKEHEETRRIEMPTDKLSEPAINEHQLATERYLSGEKVKFYSHSKTLDVKRINVAFSHYLNTHKRKAEYNGLEIEYDYSSIEIHSSGAVDKKDRVVTTEFTISDSGFVISKDEIRYNQMINKLDIKDWEERTNLLVFDGATHKGAVNLHYNLAKLYSRPQEETNFDGFDDRNIELLARFCEGMYSGDLTTDYVLGPGEILDLTKDVAEEKLMIGRDSLLEYMEVISPVIVRELMTVDGYQ